MSSSGFAAILHQFQQLSQGVYMSTPAPRLDPQKLSPTDAARLLSRVGGRPVAESTIEADVAAGAPTHGDGSLNLVAYAAWLIRQLAEGEPHGD